MSDVTINNHDFLGKLSVIKNHLFLALENIPSQKHLQIKSHLKKAYRANEEVIKMIKKSSLGKPPKSLR